jgi:hypothetical protein
MNRLDLKKENLFFYGSSMGGFTSLQLATMVRGSTAISDIPQLEFQNHVSYNKVKPYCFPGLTDDEIWDRFKHRFDVIEMMKKEDYVPKAILIFDCSNRDIDTQYIDFIKGINSLPDITDNQNKIRIVFNYTHAHEPLSNLDSRLLVNAITSKNSLAYFDELKDSQLYKEYRLAKNESQELTKALIMWGEESLERRKMDEIIRKERREKNTLQQELDDKNAQIEKLQRELQEKQEQIDTMISSNSWKLTKPLRNTMSSIKNKK